MKGGRKPRPLGRAERTFRDDRLFVIATEDRYAPKQYFDALGRLIHSSRIKTKVLPTEDCRSAPQFVLDRLEEYSRQYETHQEDQMWLMLDTDHWIQDSHISHLMDVIKRARQKGYHISINRPCFEIWLLNHHHNNAACLAIGKCSDIRPHLLAILGEYNKTKLNPDHFPLSSIYLALKHSKAQDLTPEEDIPTSNCTRVYRIVEQIVASIPEHLKEM